MSDHDPITRCTFDGRTAVVTGAASGIGLAIAARLARAGANVAMADVDAAALQAAAEELSSAPGRVITRVTNVADPEAVAELASEATRHFGTVDLVFANAGILGHWAADSAWNTSPDQWRRVLDVNVLGVTNTFNAFIPPLLESGRPGHVVVTSSAASFIAPDGHTAPYYASKHAVNAITEMLRIQLEGSAVGLSLLLPDKVRTRVIEREMVQTHGTQGIEMAAAAFAGDDVLDPDEAAAIVLDAVAAGQDLIFTHDRTPEQAAEVLDARRALLT